MIFKKFDKVSSTHGKHYDILINFKIVFWVGLFKYKHSYTQSFLLVFICIYGENFMVEKFHELACSKQTKNVNPKNTTILELFILTKLFDIFYIIR